MRWMDRDRGRRDGSEITVTDLIDAIRIRGWVKNYTNSWPGWQVYQPVIPAIRFLRMAGARGGRRKANVLIQSRILLAARRNLETYADFCSG